MKKLLNLIVSELAKQEGGKSQVSIGDLRQVMALLKKLIKQDSSFIKYLVE